MEYSEEYVSQTARDNAIYRISKNGYTLLSQNQSRNTSLIEGYLKARQPVVIAVYWILSRKWCRLSAPTVRTFVYID